MQKIIIIIIILWRGVKWQKYLNHLPQAMDENYQNIKKKKIELFHFQKAKLISMYRKKKLKYLNYIFPESS